MVEMPPGTAAADRVSESLKSAFDRKDFYEAHQIYKSLNFRFLRQKKFQQLAGILYDGATKFFDLGLDQSGIDLAKMFGDLLDKGDIPVTGDTVEKVAILYRLIPSKHETERSYFLDLAMTWSKKRSPETKTGHVAVHSAIAHILVEEEKYDGAVYHYVRALDPVRCLSTIQLVPQVKPVDSDRKDVSPEDPADAEDGSECPDQRLLGLAILDFLALQRLDLAKQLFVDYVSQHRNPEVRSKCYNFRILALVSALLSLCAKGELATAEEYGPVQTALCEIYAGNSRVEKLMTRIGQAYCKLKQQSSSPWAGLLSGIFTKEAPESAAPPSDAASSAKKVDLHSDFDFD